MPAKQGQVSQAVEKADEQRRDVVTLRDQIERSKDEFARALPNHISPERFMRVSLTALRTVPKLNECTAASVIGGLMQAAQLGLEVSDVRGQAYLIPRRNGRTGNMEASFQLGYRGMIDLAARSGITVMADEICALDQYEYQQGTNPYLLHKPSLDERGDVIAYYAVATFADRRQPSFVIEGRGAMEKHRDKFASTRNKDKEIVGTWVEHFDAMALKTVIRKLLNHLPVSVELRQQIIEAEATDASSQHLGEVAYTPGLDLHQQPSSVDLETGEITVDQTEVIEADSTDAPAGDSLPLEET